MDTYLLKAAVLYALSATQQTTTLVDEFLQNTSFTNADLDPLTYELFDLRTPLERLGDSDFVIPARLQTPILAVVRGCGDALARVDAVLGECADGSLGGNALWEAKVPEVRELKNVLQTCRRILQLALEVVNLAAAKDVGADAETFTTYLDQDTSRVLALIRRTLQQVQEGDGKDALSLALRQSLDDIRLYVQSLCRSPTRDETRPPTPLTTTATPAVETYNQDQSTSMVVKLTQESKHRLDFNINSQFLITPFFKPVVYEYADRRRRCLIYREQCAADIHHVQTDIIHVPQITKLHEVKHLQPRVQSGLFLFSIIWTIPTNATAQEPQATGVDTGIHGRERRRDDISTDTA